MCEPGNYDNERARRIRRARSTAIEPVGALGYTEPARYKAGGDLFPAGGFGARFRALAKKRHISEGWRCLRLSTPWRISLRRPAISSAERSRRKATRLTTSGSTAS